MHAMMRNVPPQAAQVNSNMHDTVINRARLSPTRFVHPCPLTARDKLTTQLIPVNDGSRSRIPMIYHQPS